MLPIEFEKGVSASVSVSVSVSVPEREMVPVAAPMAVSDDGCVVKNDAPPELPYHSDSLVRIEHIANHNIPFTLQVMPPLVDLSLRVQCWCDALWAVHGAQGSHWRRSQALIQAVSCVVE